MHSSSKRGMYDSQYNAKSKMSTGGMPQKATIGDPGYHYLICISRFTRTHDNTAYTRMSQGNKPCIVTHRSKTPGPLKYKLPEISALHRLSSCYDSRKRLLYLGRLGLCSLPRPTDRRKGCCICATSNATIAVPLAPTGKPV